MSNTEAALSGAGSPFPLADNLFRDPPTSKEFALFFTIPLAPSSFHCHSSVILIQARASEIARLLCTTHRSAPPSPPSYWEPPLCSPSLWLCLCKFDTDVNYTACSLLRLASFAQHKATEIHLNWWAVNHLLLFSRGLDLLPLNSTVPAVERWDHCVVGCSTLVNAPCFG